ncbi:MAG: YdcF family protein [Chitinophagaceae bacterium]|nr:MAG: YdcF family protein [Chitinophagaceae bacterium]
MSERPSTRNCTGKEFSILAAMLISLVLVLLRPMLWIILVFCYAFFTKDLVRKKTAFGTGLGLLLLFTNPALSTWALQAYEAEPVTLGPMQTFQTGILPGGLVSYSEKDNTGHFNNVADRFIQTALLYKGGKINNIIVAAGSSHMTEAAYSEASFIKANLVKLGIPAANIFTDTTSRNTVQNAARAKHKAGLPVSPYPCQFLSRGSGSNFFEDYLIPSSGALASWENLIKEVVSMAAYQVMGKL